MTSYVISHYHHEGWTHGFIQVVEKAVRVGIICCIILYYIMTCGFIQVVEKMVRVDIILYYVVLCYIILYYFMTCGFIQVVERN
jgi:hypothetical protein